MADAPEEEGDRFTLNTVNAVWGQHDYEFLAPFLDVLAENYGGWSAAGGFCGIRPEESRVRINDWVAERTEDRIKDLVPEDANRPVDPNGTHETQSTSTQGGSTHSSNTSRAHAPSICWTAARLTFQ